MIEKFKENEARKSALVYLSNFEQVKELYEDDKEMAGELAISILEMALTGEISSDNKMIRLMLKNFEVSAESNRQKYEAKERNTKEAKAEKYNLYEIAEMLNEGKTQAEIADTLGISRQTVSRRLNEMIRVNYPELLRSNGEMSNEMSKMSNEMSKMSKMSNDVKQCKNNENENENENVNENVNDNENDNVNDNENVKVSAEGQKKLAELDKYINDQIERVMEEKGYKLVKDFDVSVDRIQLDKEYRNRKKRILEQYKI